MYLSLNLPINKLHGDEYKRWDRTSIKCYTTDLWHRKKWRLVAQGSEFDNKLETLVVTYESCQLVQILEARRLVVPEIQEALIVIGSGQNARIKAKNGPFTIENLGLMVGFNPDGNHPPKPYISLISLLNGNILYKVRNDNNSGFELLHEESFEDALRIVEEESQHHNTTSEC